MKSNSIPNVDNPWEDAKQLILTGLKAAGIAGAAAEPYISLIVAPLMFLLFPTGDAGESWDSLRAKVEQLVDQKIDEMVYNEQKTKIDTLLPQLAYFNDLIENNAGTDSIISKYYVVQAHFSDVLIEMKNEQFDVVSLPLYALGASLYAVFLRLSVGQAERVWKMDEGAYKTLCNAAKHFYEENDKYMLSTMDKWRQRAVDAAPPLHHRWPWRFNSINAAETNITTLVDDFRVLIKYSNPFVFPDTSTVPPEEFKDVFSPAFGSHNAAEDDTTSFYSPLAQMNSIEVHKNHLSMLTGLMCVYPTGRGPRVSDSPDKRVDITPGGGHPHPPYTVTVQLPDAPEGRRYSIKGVRVAYADLVKGLVLISAGNPITVVEYSGPDHWIDFEAEGRMLSTIYCACHSGYPPYDFALSLVIFGFSRDFEEETDGVRRSRYIAGGAANEISGIPENLLEERKMYQQRLAALVSNARNSQVRC
ncbi:insecticidal delta-endotoxin Cry8Ea1 family protein [Brucella intermedia]|uniref:insecticidal delta-endotoxin Cry8Ea1 family protein n=1 Tax=Brucella intermedia TaxID=94625 RepID=UPI000469AD33|nr:insecticidal delta-endotoxin Cry8Ea1 family protein [Brucella intermedia]